MSTSSTSFQSRYEAESTTPPLPASLPSWKLELNEKLAAHRQRAGATVRRSEPSERPILQERRAGQSSVAARVAERYAKAPSYRDFLAASAAASAAAAETAAFAARQAREAAEAHAQLAAEAESQARDQTQSQTLSSPTEERPAPSEPSLWATVEHREPLPARNSVPPRPAAPAGGLFAQPGIVDALAEATVPAAVGLPAKLIEFPRELVAARKSRPRIAEGPLASEPEAPLFADAESRSLRIFEVESEAVDSLPNLSTSEAAHTPPYPGLAEQPSHSPHWQPIYLGEHPSEAAAEPQTAVAHSRPGQSPAMIQNAATIADRTMAALVDVAIVGISFVLFLFVFTVCVAHPPVGRIALACGGILLAAFFFFYQWLFLSYSSATPGMHYAQIALCTFDDQNPTRAMRRKRFTASLLSVFSFGLGLLWVFFDENGLGWHDRISRSYQRSYR